MKHFVTTLDYGKDELMDIIKLSMEIKKSVQSGYYPPLLKNKVVGLIFEHASTRTRCSIETAVSQLGGYPQYLSMEQLQFSKQESIEDTAIVLSRLMDMVAIRMRDHASMECFAKNSSVPIINAMSDYNHPTQEIGDIITIFERLPADKALRDVKVVFVGDMTQVCVSLMFITTKMGMKFAHYAPKGYQLNEDCQKIADALCKTSGGGYEITDDEDVAMKNADFVYTDVWRGVSGQERSKEDRMRIFAPKYQVSRQMLAKASPNVKFMHCLPAMRDEEVSYDVISDPKISIVYDEAENRLTAMRGILAYIARHSAKKYDPQRVVDAEQDLNALMTELFCG